MSHGEDAAYHANEDCLGWCTRRGVQPQSDLKKKILSMIYFVKPEMAFSRIFISRLSGQEQPSAPSLPSQRHPSLETRRTPSTSPVVVI